jgi:hypothetical protein
MGARNLKNGFAYFNKVYVGGAEYFNEPITISLFKFFKK